MTETQESKINASEGLVSAWNDCKGSTHFFATLCWGMTVYLLVFRADLFLQSSLGMNGRVAKYLALCFAIPWMGYLVDTMASARNAREIPPFSPCFDYFKDGVKVVLTSVVYLAIACLPILSLYLLKDIKSGWVWAVGLLITLVSLVLIVTATVMLPLAICRYAINRELAEAFQVRTIYRAYKKRESYFRNIILVLVGIPFAIGIVLSLVKISAASPLLYFALKSACIPIWKLLCAVTLGRASRVLFDEATED